MQETEKLVKGRHKVKRVEFIDKDKQIVLGDIERHSRKIAIECIKVWDSMEGAMPSFAGFCGMYMQEKMKKWFTKARWN